MEFLKNLPTIEFVFIIIKFLLMFSPFFSVAAAAASGLTNNPPANGTATFPNGAAGASPYVLSPQDQQQFLAAMSAGQILPGET